MRKNIRDKKVVSIVMGMLLLVSLASCSKPNIGTEKEKHHSHHHESIDVKDMASYGFIKLKDHYFKLASDISQKEESHIDFYFKDSEAKHISEAEIKLILNRADLSKEEFTLAEDKAGEHYHTKTMLKSGKYKAVVQVKKDGEIYNPRFEFEV